MLFFIFQASVKVWHISRPGEAGGGHVASGHLAECLRGYLGRGGEQRSSGRGRGYWLGWCRGAWSILTTCHHQGRDPVLSPQHQHAVTRQHNLHKLSSRTGQGPRWWVDTSIQIKYFLCCSPRAPPPSCRPSTRRAGRGCSTSATAGRSPASTTPTGPGEL